jgi:hypothetical protein
MPRAAAATKAAPKATSKPAQKDEPDLLAEMNTEVKPTVQDDDDDFDLLSDMSESDATAWIPWDEDDDQPNGIQGTVTHVGTVTQDAKYGGNDVPYIEIRDKNDDDLIWGVRGYATVLANQLQREIDNGLSNGDFIAVVFLGVQSNRKGDNEYKNFRVKSIRR